MIYIILSSINALLLFCVFERWYKLQVQSLCLLCTMFWINVAATIGSFSFGFEWTWILEPVLFIEYAAMPFVLTVLTSAWYFLLKNVH